MSIRRRSRLRLATLLGVAIFGMLSVPSSHAEELKSLGSAEATYDDWKGAKVNINSIQKSEKGNYVTVVWTINNGGETEIKAGDFLHDVYMYTEGGVTSITLVDEKKNIRYNVVQDSDGYCLCAGNSWFPQFRSSVESGNSVTYWSSFILADDTNEVTVNVPGFESVEGVPVG